MEKMSPRRMVSMLKHKYQRRYDMLGESNIVNFISSLIRKKIVAVPAVPAVPIGEATSPSSLHAR